MRHVEGNILDDDVWGKRLLREHLAYPSLTFTKIYRSGGASAVHYSGTMSEDEESYVDVGISPAIRQVPVSLNGIATALLTPRHNSKQNLSICLEFLPMSTINRTASSRPPLKCNF